MLSGGPLSRSARPAWGALFVLLLLHHAGTIESLRELQSKVQMYPEDQEVLMGFVQLLRENDSQGRLNIKTAIQSWDLDSDQPRACGWQGITCSIKDGRIVKLELENDGYYGELPKIFSDLEELVELRLGRNAYEGSLPAEWSVLTNLQVLYLNDNQLTDELPEEWSKLIRLRTLHLERNRLDDELPKEYSELRLMENLYLNDNEFEGSLPNEWSTMNNLSILGLSGNNFQAREAWQDEECNEDADEAPVVPLCYSSSVQVDI